MIFVFDVVWQEIFVLLFFGLKIKYSWICLFDNGFIYFRGFVFVVLFWNIDYVIVFIYVFFFVVYGFYCVEGWFGQLDWVMWICLFVVIGVLVIYCVFFWIVFEDVDVLCLYFC